MFALRVIVIATFLLLLIITPQPVFAATISYKITDGIPGRSPKFVGETFYTTVV